MGNAGPSAAPRTSREPRRSGKLDTRLIGKTDTAHKTAINDINGLVRILFARKPPATPEIEQKKRASERTELSVGERHFAHDRPARQANHRFVREVNDHKGKHEPNV